MTVSELAREIERLQDELEKQGVSSFLVTVNLDELAAEIKEYRCPHDDIDWIRSELQQAWDDFTGDMLVKYDHLGEYLSD
jgi:hypothetical protein